jgi:uncharacterized protein YjfI (DUF2170 family)
MIPTLNSAMLGLPTQIMGTHRVDPRACYQLVVTISSMSSEVKNVILEIYSIKMKQDSDAALIARIQSAETVFWTLICRRNATQVLTTL